MIENELAPPAPHDDDERDARVRAVTRPEGALMVLYVLKSLAALPVCWIVIWPLLFRYKTLRYGFEDDGISVRWGILFRREVHLTYRRIQDIHVSRNIVERWLGIGTVAVQTASGSGDAEAQIEGVTEFDAIRDFLYAKSRGTRGDDRADGGDAAAATPAAEDPVALLEEIRDTLRLLADRTEPQDRAETDA